MESQSAKLRSRRPIRSEVERKSEMYLSNNSSSYRRSIPSEDFERKSENIYLSSNSSSNDEFTEEKVEEEEDEEEEEEEEEVEVVETKNQQKKINQKYILLPLSLLLISLLIKLYFIPEETEIDSDTDIDIERLKYQFPSQEEDFWLNIQVAVEEVINLNQPKSIIFLYKHEKPIEHILLSISEYASLKILSDLKDPVVVNSEDLHRQDILEDYGVFITEIKEKLQTSAVVIVKNLDKIPGKAAQAFHSLCDEYNPVQEKVLYLFTIKGDTFPEQLLNFVENKLRKHWSDLHSDKFYPLITRMSSFILKVQ